jgi:hypothetical protein
MKKNPRKIGTILLATWFILWGLKEIIQIFSALYLAVAILAILTGIFIFLDR